MCRPTTIRIRSRGSERVALPKPLSKAKGGFRRSWIEKEGEGVRGANDENVCVE